MTDNDLRNFIRDVPDFPKPGILFKDITPMLRSPRALETACRLLAEPFRDANVTQVAGIESRGFIFGSIVARNLGAGFIPIRKPGKLPWSTRRHEYVLEYGSDALEVHDDALESGDRVLVIDDVLATGGTLAAATHLVRGFDATLVGAATVIELSFLNGREKMGTDTPFHAVLRY
ncbi:MAG: adenine phosphoribosyltransferase [Acidobacteria bacterium]|nr:adenine phosphoribosyltransferase [Acidobacteriota bacterium]MBV9476452.1 adenine phosphoribosyltransferase [Acidobacteriota bacterium]